MKNKGVIELSIGTIVIIVLAMSMFILGLVLVRSIFDEPHFKISYMNESGEFVEVDEIIACCFDTLPIDYVENKTFCVPEENLIFLNLSCEPLKKKDLTREWLDINTACIYEGFLHNESWCYNAGDSDGEKIIDIGEEYCETNQERLNRGCNYYKFGKYTVEAWNQIK